VVITIDEEGMARAAVCDRTARLSPSASNSASHPTKSSLILWHYRFLLALKKIEPMVALRLQPSAACVKNCPVVTFGSFQYFLRFEPAARVVLNSMFLHLAMEAGMDAAIVS